MMEHRDLEMRLRDLSSRLEMPKDPDLAGGVRVAIVASRAERSSGFGSDSGWRARAVPALAVLALVVAGLASSPTTRSAVADWIGLDGLRIGFGEVEKDALGIDLNLGRRTDLEDAGQRAGFDIGVPAVLGSPDEVYLTGEPMRVSLVYAPREGLPRTASTRVGVLLSVFKAQLGDDVIFKKTAGTGTDIEPIDVNGSPGYWISGDTHALFYYDERGKLLEDRARLAGNTLAWQRGGLIYRMESALSKARALEIARSIP